MGTIIKGERARGRRGPTRTVSQTRMLRLLLRIGGWGFLFFTQPRVICRLACRLACQLARCNDPTARRLKFVKAVGAVELSLVFTALVFTALVLTAILGSNS